MNNKINILLIEDDKSICSFITTSLDNNGYKVTVAPTGKEGISLTASLCPSAILLDLGLPDMDGMEVLSQIRSWSATPVIVISARTKEQEKVAALDNGADDYITKPFGTDELMARIRTSLRHRRTNATRLYRSGGLRIDFDRRRIFLDDSEVHLTQIEYQLLSLLAESAGKVLTYGHIMQTIWGPYTDGSNQILRVNMANIRRKIEKNPAQPQYVFTEVGIGYRMAEGDTISNPS